MATIRKRSWVTPTGERGEAWVADYRDQAGRRRNRQFKTRKAADRWLVTARHQVAQGTHTADSSSCTVAEAAQLWLERCEQEGLEGSTMAGYRSHVRHHIGPLLGAEKLSRLTVPRIEQFRDELLAGGRSRPLARKILGSVKAILKEAQRRGLVAQNVARDVSIRTASRHKKRAEVGRDIPTPAEVRELLATTQGRWRPLLVTAVFTGMRASELRALTWKHVDLKRRVIHVRQRADTSGRMGSLKSSGSRRDIPMSPMLVNTLQEWRLACPPSELGLVFAGRSCGISCHTTLGTALGRMHRFRHFFASWLIDQGFGPKRVQTLMGHSGIQITLDTYAHLFPQDDDHERFAAGELALVR